MRNTCFGIESRFDTDMTEVAARSKMRGYDANRMKDSEVQVDPESKERKTDRYGIVRTASLLGSHAESLLISWPSDASGEGI